MGGGGAGIADRATLPGAGGTVDRRAARPRSPVPGASARLPPSPRDRRERGTPGAAERGHARGARDAGTDSGGGARHPHEEALPADSPPSRRPAILVTPQVAAVSPRP